MRIFINARRALGDCVYFLLALKKIRDKFPKAGITLVSWDSTHELFSYSGLADNCISNSRYLEMTPAEINDLTAGADILVDLQTTPESAIGVKRSDAAVKIAAFLPPDPIQYEDLYTHRLRLEKGEHIRTYLLRGFNQALETDPEPEAIPIARPDEIVRKVDIMLRDLGFGQGEFMVGIHPGAKEAIRRWEPEKWARVADWLAFFRTARVVLFGSDLASWGGAEIADIRDNERIWRLAKRKPVNLTGATPGPLVLAEFMRQLGLYAGLDTGPTHLAAAVEVPTLGIYLYRSPDHYKAWRLLGPNTRIITSNDLQTLTVDEVTREIRLLLGLG